jgi:hypothetical protein
MAHPIVHTALTPSVVERIFRKYLSPRTCEYSPKPKWLFGNKVEAMVSKMGTTMKKQRNKSPGKIRPYR